MKKILFASLLLCLLAPITIEAKKKSFGKGLYWELSDDGTLTISGKGAMPNFKYRKSPWYNYNNSIKDCLLFVKYFCLKSRTEHQPWREGQKTRARSTKNRSSRTARNTPIGKRRLPWATTPAPEEGYENHSPAAPKKKYGQRCRPPLSTSKTKPISNPLRPHCPSGSTFG